MVRLTTHTVTSDLIPMMRSTVNATRLTVTPTAWRQASATRSPSVYLGNETQFSAIAIFASSSQGAAASLPRRVARMRQGWLSRRGARRALLSDRRLDYWPQTLEPVVQTYGTTTPVKHVV